MTFGPTSLPPTAAEEMLEIVMRRYERTSTLLTSNRPVDDWGKLRPVQGLQCPFSRFQLALRQLDGTSPEAKKQREALVDAG